MMVTIVIILFLLVEVDYLRAVNGPYRKEHGLTRETRKDRREAVLRMERAFQRSDPETIRGLLRAGDDQAIEELMRPDEKESRWRR